MRLLQILSTLAIFFLTISGHRHFSEDNHWANWKNTYDKSYEFETEEQNRYEIFLENKHFIMHRHPHITHSLHLNEFADISKEEWSNRFIKSDRQLNLGWQVIPKPTVIALEIDWRDANKNPEHMVAVNPVKNQQQCGSCWAFSTIASVETRWAIAKKQLVSLSEQELVDCSTSFGNNGCNGGLMDQAFQYIIANGGVCSEQSYPYTATDGTCQSSNCKSLATISSYNDVQPMNETQLLFATMSGTVSIAIEADSQDFQFYSGGVFNSPNCGTNLDHGVAIVGFGYDSTCNLDYWIVRNSWGPSWGEQGYIRIVRGQNMCGLAQVPSYPIV